MLKSSPVQRGKIMAKAVYLAGDFSGIQRFVLGVKSAGKAQAKRLRARSFLLELFEHAALLDTEGSPKNR